MSWQLYAGGKYRHLGLSNSSILEASLSDKINEPLSLVLKFDLTKLLRQGDQLLINYLIDYNSDFYLENRKLGIGYKFIKKHNQNQKTIIIQKNETSFIVPTGIENLNIGFGFSSETFQTALGVGAVINNTLLSNDRYETIITSEKSNSQNLVSSVQSEEISIAGQSIDNDILTLTLLSGSSLINYQKMGLAYGQFYQLSLVSFLTSLLPDYQIQSNINPVINYTIEVKQNQEIINDVLTNVYWRDGGFDLVSQKQIIQIIDPKSILPTARLHNCKTLTRGSGLILSIRNNYPSISAEIITGFDYIRAGEKVKIIYNSKTTNYQGDLIYAGNDIDLLFNYSNKSSTVQLLKTARDVRENYLDQNLKTLTQKII